MVLALRPKSRFELGKGIRLKIKPSVRDTVRDKARVRDKGIRLGIKPRVRNMVRDKARVRIG